MNQKSDEMAYAIRCISSLLKKVRPNLHVDIAYRREDEKSVQDYSIQERLYHHILSGDENIYIWNAEDGVLLYTVHVTGDSVLTACSELMELLSRKF